MDQNVGKVPVFNTILLKYHNFNYKKEKCQPHNMGEFDEDKYDELKYFDVDFKSYRKKIQRTHSRKNNWCSP